MSLPALSQCAKENRDIKLVTAPSRRETERNERATILSNNSCNLGRDIYKRHSKLFTRMYDSNVILDFQYNKFKFHTSNV